jgi:hypothetical protein
MSYHPSVIPEMLHDAQAYRFIEGCLFESHVFGVHGKICRPIVLIPGPCDRQAFGVDIDPQDVSAGLGDQGVIITVAAADVEDPLSRPGIQPADQGPAFLPAPEVPMIDF